MWLPFQENTANQMPVDRQQLVRVRLRNGREMPGYAGNFSWGDVGSASITHWALPDPNAPQGTAPAPPPRRVLRDDALFEAAPKKKKKPTRYEQLSRCLPDGVLWGDEMTFETVDKILESYCNSEW